MRAVDWLKNNGYFKDGEVGEQVLELLETLRDLDIESVLTRDKILSLFVHLARDESINV